MRNDDELLTELRELCLRMFGLIFESMPAKDQSTLRNASRIEEGLRIRRLKEAIRSVVEESPIRLEALTDDERR